VFTRPLQTFTQTTPTLLIIDSDEERSQRLAHILSMSGYRPLVKSTLYQAMELTYREQITPAALLLGQADLPQHHLFPRFVSRLGRRKGQSIYLIPSLFRRTIPDEPPLCVKLASPSSHTLSPESLNILNTVATIAPSPIRYQQLKVDTHALALETLPSVGLFPRLSLHRHVRSSYFLQALKAAHGLIENEQWENLMGDVGLAQYRQMNTWPPDTDAHVIPMEYLSYLQQAIIFSRPQEPAQQLRQWGYTTMDNVLQKRGLPMLAQQALRLLPQENQVQMTLNAFTRQMNEIRNEDLHAWAQHHEGTYWLVHYSNLYAYGRINSPQEPACHVWVAALERVFRQVGLDANWAIKEKECSCQTLTGHCVFEISPR